MALMVTVVLLLSESGSIEMPLVESEDIMANIPQVNVGGIVYNLKDAESRNQIDEIKSALSTGNIECLANIEEAYINSSGMEVENRYLRCSDYIRIPQNAIGFQVYVFYNTSSPLNPVACLYSEDHTFIKHVDYVGHNSGIKTFYVTDRQAKFVRFNQSFLTDDKENCLFTFIFPSTGYVGSFSGTFTSAKQQLDTGIILKATKKYKIKSLIPMTKDVNLFIKSHSFPNSKILPNDLIGSFTPADTGSLIAYNVRDNLDPISIVVYEQDSEIEKIYNGKRVYHVAKNNAEFADYSSLTQCFLDLKDNDDEKIIYIDGGDYDIFQEYIDAGVPVYTGDSPTSDYYDYCVWVPKNTHLIGRGIVRLLWMPEASSTTIPQSKTVSVLNVSGSCTIENIEVHGKNCRYCLHNDALRNSQFYGAVQKYINVKFHKYTSDRIGEDFYGFLHTIGFGIDDSMRHEYINCEFYNDESTGQSFYGHNRAVATSTEESPNSGSPSILLENCVINSISSLSLRLDSSYGTASERISTKILNCYIQHNIRLVCSDSVSNVYDLLILNSHYDDVIVDDPNNRYPVSIYPPTT